MRKLLKPSQGWWPKICVIVAFFLIVGCTMLTNLVDKGESKQILPENFQQWEVLKILPASPGLFWVLYKNPDSDLEIKIIAALIDIQKTVYSYRYFKGVNIYEFVLDRKTGKYVGGLITGETRRICLECHQDKIVIGEAI